MAQNICDYFAMLTQNPKNSDEFISKVQAIGKSLLEDCCVCMQVMDKHIILCVNGHSICGSCAERVDKCPICKDQMTEIRNFRLEELYKCFEDKNNNTPLERCCFKKCDMKDTKEMMVAHRKICQYGESAVCAWCRSMVFHNNVLDHWKSHCQEVNNGVYFQAIQPAFLKVCGEHFLVTRHKIDSYYIFNVHHLTEEGKTDFWFKLSLKNYNSGRTLSINGPCVVSTPVEAQDVKPRIHDVRIYGITVDQFHQLYLGCDAKYMYKVIVYSRNPDKM